MKQVYLFIMLLCFCSCKEENKEWAELLDKDLSDWNTYLSYKFPKGSNGKIPLDSTGQKTPPIGYNKNTNTVFSIVEDKKELVLRISGEIYGCIFTKEEFENYHLKLKVKWGDKTWHPRKNNLMDSGLLYHSIGEVGNDYWHSWMLSQEFQIIENNTGDYWSIAKAGIDIRAELPENSKRAVANHKAPFLKIGNGGDYYGFCERSINNESPLNDWTTLELICFQNKSLHIVNGKVVMVLKNSRYLKDNQILPLTKGKIQLQSEGAEVFFKDIKIKKLHRLPKSYEIYYQ
ncbi:3-keto-disaccharide hydrolase [Seonamhaeicola marinus]|nr:DUF1080 domain-containing protein [Seonamhaeicola marinus]